MKYKLAREEKGGFVPFSLTLTFETEAEYIYFQDHVAFKLAEFAAGGRISSSVFAGNLYDMARNKKTFAEGSVSDE